METVVSKDGTGIAVERVGEGAPAVYVGGALNTRGSGAALAGLLAPEFTVFNYDRRGRGDSGDAAPYAVEREIEDLAAVIALAGGGAAVFGISSGGALALEAAARGAGISALALYEVPYNVEEDGRSREYAAELDRLLSDGRRGDALALFMTQMGMPAEMVDQMRGAPVWPALEAVAPTLAYDSSVMGHRERGGELPAERLAGVTVPALVMDGGASPAGLREAAGKLAEALPGGRHRTLAGQAHDVAPDALAPVVREFLRKVRR